MKLLFVLIAFVLLVACVPSPTTWTPAPTPQPTPTSIPGYVGGEEKYALASFSEYYTSALNWCLSREESRSIGYGVDDESPGEAVYVGDGIWRFRIHLIKYDESCGQPCETSEEKFVETRSLPDRTWERVCYSEEEYDAMEEESNRERDREQEARDQYYDDMANEEEPPESQEWP